MTQFKILIDKDSKIVVLQGKINEYNDYTALKQKIIDKSQQNSGIKNPLKDNDIFILSFFEDLDKDPELYIPEEVRCGIFNKATFQYFKDKLLTHKVHGKKYKFYVNRMDKLPKWKQKEFKEHLKSALDNEWDRTFKTVNNQLSSLKLEESSALYKKLKEEKDSLEQKLNQEKHYKIICNNCCDVDFTGKRFICAECNNYNLCQKCEQIFYQKQIHSREHTLIQINKAIKQNDIYNYSNIISNTEFEFKNVPSSFVVNFTIVNNGEKEWEKCYFLPVRYGENCLGCSIKQIDKKIEQNESIVFNLVVRIPKETKGYYEGFFRMFTSEGLPFGDILHIKVLNGD